MFSQRDWEDTRRTPGPGIQTVEIWGRVIRVVYQPRSSQRGLTYLLTGSGGNYVSESIGCPVQWEGFGRFPERTRQWDESP